MTPKSKKSVEEIARDLAYDAFDDPESAAFGRLQSAIAAAITQDRRDMAAIAKHEGQFHSSNNTWQSACEQVEAAILATLTEGE